MTKQADEYMLYNVFRQDVFHALTEYGSLPYHNPMPVEEYTTFHSHWTLGLLPNCVTSHTLLVLPEGALTSLEWQYACPCRYPAREKYYKEWTSEEFVGDERKSIYYK
jgi:hypothetical protein